MSLAVFVLSAATLGYEILLMRLFSIILWHHFAYMMISLALLGFGASGTFLALTQARLSARFRATFAASAALFGLTAVGAFALAQRVPFNPLEVIWDWRQQIYLLGIYLLLAVPFFCAGTAIGLALFAFRDRISAIYRADLLGAGVGALMLVLGLFVLWPVSALELLGAAGFVAAALVLLDPSRRRSLAAAATLLAIGLVSPLVWPADWLALRLSPYKGLSQTLEIPDTEIFAERSSPLGLLTVVRSPTIPFRHAPGLSFTSPVEPPPQLGVFTDGDAMTAITRFDGDWGRVAYLDHQSAALPFHLLERPRVLILGAGGGADVLLALSQGAATVDAVELNPQLVDLVRDAYADFAGHLYDRPRVRVHVGEARGFVASTRERYDLIHVALLDSFSAPAGVQALGESTIYTVEAFVAYLDRLAPGGFLAITRWLQVPPKDSLKLFATAVKALERAGVAEPGRRLAMARSWQTVTLLVKNGELTQAEIAAIRGFAEERSLDVAYYPGMSAGEANRFNVLDEPYFFNGAKALLGPDRDGFLRDYKFNIAPATDDRPYFFHFLKLRTLPELLSLRAGGGLVLTDWSYLILLATLAQATVASVVLILLPLRALHPASSARHAGVGRVAVYFLALGLAFLFIEIAFIHRFVLFLSHPLYAIAVVLAAFLVFAGLGSGYSTRVERYASRWPLGAAGLPAVALPIAAIAAIALLYLAVLPPLFAWLRPLPDPAKVAVSALLIAPLAFAMGMPFPLGLRRLAQDSPEWIPWAWGINGCASVVSAVLATLLAIHLGFSAVIAIAVALYVLAAAAFGRKGRGAGPA